MACSGLTAIGTCALPRHYVEGSGLFPSDSANIDRLLGEQVAESLSIVRSRFAVQGGHGAVTAGRSRATSKSDTARIFRILA